MHKIVYIVIDNRNNKYKIKSVGFTSTTWVTDIKKAQIFRTKAAAKKGMYSFNINPERGKIGAKIILPEWVEIKPITISFFNDIKKGSAPINNLQTLYRELNMIKNIKKIIKEVMQLNFMCEEMDFIGEIEKIKRKEVIFEDFNR